MNTRRRVSNKFQGFLIQFPIYGPALCCQHFLCFMLRSRSIQMSGVHVSFQGLRVIMKAIILLDCEQSLFFFRFSESNARARERRSRETRETRVAAREEKRESLFFRVSPVSRHRTCAWPFACLAFCSTDYTKERDCSQSIILSVLVQKSQRHLLPSSLAIKSVPRESSPLEVFGLSNVKVTELTDKIPC